MFSNVLLRPSVGKPLQVPRNLSCFSLLFHISCACALHSNPCITLFCVSCRLYSFAHFIPVFPSLLDPKYEFLSVWMTAPWCKLIALPCLDRAHYQHDQHRTCFLSKSSYTAPDIPRTINCNVIANAFLRFPPSHGHNVSEIHSKIGIQTSPLYFFLLDDFAFLSLVAFCFLPPSTPGNGMICAFQCPSASQHSQFWRPANFIWKRKGWEGKIAVLVIQEQQICVVFVLSNVSSSWTRARN